VSLSAVTTNDRFSQHCVISSSGGNSCLEAHYELMRVCLPIEFRYGYGFVGGCPWLGFVTFKQGRLVVYWFGEWDEADWCAEDLLGLGVWLEVGLALCSWWRAIGVVG
jgi:hypothetical protein